MALTLSHQSALDVIRTLRSEGEDLNQMDSTYLAKPSAFVGRRWDVSNFTPDVWRWQRPSPRQPLHVLVPANCGRIRGSLIKGHMCKHDLPAGSIIWLDEHSSVVCPELLFLQMAEHFSLPALIMLGHELCGHFTRDAREPLTGPTTDGIPAVTNVVDLKRYVSGFKGVRGLRRAHEALHYIHDHALSAPEAVLATVYALPPEESGYGLGEVLLNDRVQVDDAGMWYRSKTRYPDITLSFAPVGLNYDGYKHFNIGDLMVAAEVFARAGVDTRDEAREALRRMLVETREKVLDDNMRDRQLAAQGKIILPATKEDLASGRSLDALTRQVLICARNTFGVDVSDFLQTIDDTSRMRDRWDLLDTLLPTGGLGKPSYGMM